MPSYDGRKEVSIDRVNFKLISLSRCIRILAIIAQSDKQNQPHTKLVFTPLATHNLQTHSGWKHHEHVHCSSINQSKTHSDHCHIGKRGSSTPCCLPLLRFRFLVGQKPNETHWRQCKRVRQCERVGNCFSEISWIFYVVLALRDACEVCDWVWVWLCDCGSARLSVRPRLSVRVWEWVRVSEWTSVWSERQQRNTVQRERESKNE